MSLPSIRDLQKRYDPEEDDLRVPENCLLSGGGLPRSNAKLVLDYLAGLGLSVMTLDDLVEAICGLEDEEELSAFRCQEGVAVANASDGWWLLFVDGAS